MAERLEKVLRGLTARPDVCLWEEGFSDCHQNGFPSTSLAKIPMPIAKAQSKSTIAGPLSSTEETVVWFRAWRRAGRARVTSDGERLEKGLRGLTARPDVCLWEEGFSDCLCLNRI